MRPIRLDQYHQIILEKLFIDQIDNQTGKQKGLTRYVLERKYKKIEGMGHSTVLKKTKELENKGSIRSITRTRKSKGKETQHEKFVITTTGVISLLIKKYFEKKHLSHRTIDESVSSLKSFFPWMFDNWKKLIKLYDKIGMFEKFILIAYEIEMDYKIQKKSNIIIIKDNISNRKHTAKCVDPYEYYGNYITLILAHELLLNSVSNVEHTIIPKDIHSGNKLLELIKKDKNLWQAYKQNIKLGTDEHSNELKMLKRIDEAINKLDKN